MFRHQEHHLMLYHSVGALDIDGVCPAGIFSGKYPLTLVRTGCSAPANASYPWFCYLRKGTLILRLRC